MPGVEAMEGRVSLSALPAVQRAIAAFNPQPDPPGRSALPAVQRAIAAFNPQPDPPGR